MTRRPPDFQKARSHSPPLPRWKRAMDLLGALLGLLALGPLMLLIAGLVRWKMGRPIFFIQTRPGKDGKPFRMYKFRTMLEAFDAEGRPLPDERRLTRFGRWLRRTSLDELPELFNVLKGEMSLVGPRPLLMEYLSVYTPEEFRRHETPPGITGWAQVNGRNAVDWDRRLAMDVWYVENRSLWLDLRILFRTAIEAVRGRGVQAPGHATMPDLREIRLGERRGASRDG